MKVWIFQSRPDQYDLLKEVPARIHTGDWWTVPRLRNEMQKDDLLLFWRSGYAAGIYATGRITGTKPCKINGKWRIDVHYDGLLKTPILKKQLLRNNVLRKLTVIRQPRGGNFRVTRGQWNRLKHFRLLREVIQDKPSGIPDSIRCKVDESGAFDPQDARDARKRIATSIVLRQGQPEFRRQLLGFYNGKCVITGCDTEEVLEAAHILPYRGKYTNHPENGLLLRADLHILFDLHLLSVDMQSMTLLISPSLKRTVYGSLQGSAY
jgi:HNH endonuclease/EVE domain-containing protein